MSLLSRFVAIDMKWHVSSPWLLGSFSAVTCSLWCMQIHLSWLHSVAAWHVPACRWRTLDGVTSAKCIHQICLWLAFWTSWCPVQLNNMSCSGNYVALQWNRGEQSPSPQGQELGYWYCESVHQIPQRDCRCFCNFFLTLPDPSFSRWRLLPF
jgi:hypothetical protein